MHNSQQSNTIIQLPEIEILCEKKQESNVPKVLPKTFKQHDKPLNNAQVVEVIDNDYNEREIKINSTYYGAKMHILNSWSLCTVVGIVKSEQVITLMK